MDMSFYRLCVARAFRDTNIFFGLSRERAMPAILVWAITTCIIYLVADKNDFIQEITLGWASMIAIFVTWPMVFMAHLFLSPSKIYADALKKIEEKERKIQKISNTEDILLALSDFYLRGKDLYFSGFSSDETKKVWDQKFALWSQDVEDYLTKHTNISALHSFKNAKYGSMHFSHENFNNPYFDSGSFLKDIQAFSEKLCMLDDYIQFNPSEWRNDLNESLSTERSGKAAPRQASPVFSTGSRKPNVERERERPPPPR